MFFDTCILLSIIQLIMQIAFAGKINSKCLLEKDFFK